MSNFLQVFKLFLWVMISKQSCTIRILVKSSFSRWHSHIRVIPEDADELNVSLRECLVFPIFHIEKMILLYNSKEQQLTRRVTQNCYVSFLAVYWPHNTGKPPSVFLLVWKCNWLPRPCIINMCNAMCMETNCFKLRWPFWLILLCD